MASAEAGVVIVAGGRGVRAAAGAGEERKQFRDIAGVKMLLRAIRPFAQHPKVGAIVVVLPAAVAANPPEWLVAGGWWLVAGGETRQQSVSNGVDRLSAWPSVRLILVHDAARPFVDAELIDRVLQVAALGVCAVPGLPLTDTIKETDTAGLVVRTVPRERLVAVQTPQGFPREMLETAHQRARADATITATDDAALCERLGYPVRIVPGSRRNMKVTTGDDFQLADAMAQEDARTHGRTDARSVQP